MVRPVQRVPDFRNLAAVFEKRAPQRPTLFELFLNDGLIASVSGMPVTQADPVGWRAATIRAFDSLGYDYAIFTGSDFYFPTGAQRHAKTVSLNDGAVITDRASFDRYAWPDPENSDYSVLSKAAEALPEGMRLMIWSADGLLETVTKLLGYENMCYLLYDDEQLVADVFGEVGKRYYTYFKRCMEHPRVAALVSSDDWGFNTQTLLPVKTLRQFLFPWQRRYVELAHGRGKYAVLHSCGYFQDIIGDVIEMGFDARHSYEDAITPVEQAYVQLQGKIAVLGGLDMNFMAEASPEEIAARAKRMLEASAQKGGYALGTGNSVADYIPWEHYEAMIRCAF